MDTSKLDIVMFNFNNYIDRPTIKYILENNLKLFPRSSLHILSLSDIKKEISHLKQARWCLSEKGYGESAFITDEARLYFATLFKNTLYLDADTLLTKEFEHLVDITNLDFLFPRWDYGNFSTNIFLSTNYGKDIISDMYRLYEQSNEEDYTQYDALFIKSHLPQETINYISNIYYLPTINTTFHFGYSRFDRFYDEILKKGNTEYIIPYFTRYPSNQEELVNQFGSIWSIGVDFSPNYFRKEFKSGNIYSFILPNLRIQEMEKLFKDDVSFHLSKLNIHPVFKKLN